MTGGGAGISRCCGLRGPTRSGLALVLGGALAAAVAGCSRPLPEEGSPAALLYAARCGGCHAAYQPHTLTATMWKLQVDRMEQKYRAAGIAVPAGEEKEQILAYLTRHAGG